MNKEEVISELNVAIPYLLFYQAIAIFYLTVSHIINFGNVKDLVLLYLLSFVFVIALIKAGIELKRKNRLGIIILIIYSVAVLMDTIIRPVYVDVFKYSGDVIFLLATLFLIFVNWKKWGNSNSK